MKKAQITIFLIIGIILLIATVAGFYVKENYAKSINNNPKEIGQLNENDLKNYVQTCLEKSAENAILSTGKLGGYFNETPKAYSTYGFFEMLPLYSHGTINSAPNLEKIESQLSFFVDTQINECVKKINQTEQTETKNYETTFGIPKTKTIILEKQIVFNLNFPISLSKNNEVKKIDSFSTKVDSRYKQIYDIAINITKNQIQAPTKLCLSCIKDQIKENDLEVHISDRITGILIIDIIDKRTKINNQEFVFTFANTIQGELNETKK